MCFFLGGSYCLSLMVHGAWLRARAYPCFRQFGSFMKILKWISCLSYSVAMVHGWSRLWYLKWKLLVSGFPNCYYSIFPRVHALEGIVPKPWILFIQPVFRKVKPMNQIFTIFHTFSNHIFMEYEVHGNQGNPYFSIDYEIRFCYPDYVNPYQYGMK